MFHYLKIAHKNLTHTTLGQKKEVYSFTCIPKILVNLQKNHTI
jgi:hypothetical protein